MRTIKDVARLAGVSVSTVSFVLNGNKFVSEELRQRVLHCVSELGYHPNNTARRLRLKQTETIGLIVGDLTNPFYPQVARAVTEEARKHGFSTILTDSRGTPRGEVEAALELSRDRIIGAILETTDSSGEAARILAEQGIPVVVVNQVVPVAGVDTVLCDNQGGVSMVINYLIEKGHQSIGFIGGHPNSYASGERLRGYVTAMERNGLTVNKRWVRYGLHTHEGGYLCARDLLGAADGVTAIMASSDLMAIGALDAAMDAGLSVPGDVAIVGFDDIWVSSLRAIQLTTVRQHPDQLGRAAVHMLIARPQSSDESNYEGKKLILPCELVVRKTG